MRCSCIRGHVLDPVEPHLPAQTGDNTRDSVEQITPWAPLTGIYSIHMSCKHALAEYGQHYSLLVTGAAPFDTEQSRFVVTTGARDLPEQHCRGKTSLS